MTSPNAIALPLLPRLPEGRKIKGKAVSWMKQAARFWYQNRLDQLSLWPWLGVSGDAGHLAEPGRMGLGRGGGFDPLEPAPDGLQNLPHYHEPVLCKEIMEFLQPSPATLIMDATLGGGGHSEMFLNRGARVIALDQDPVAIAYACSRLRAHASQFCALRGNFRRFPELLSEIGVKELDGILADIGVSSKQLDDASKGFSFMHDGPLDLRMNPDGPMTAEHLINTASAEELERIFKEYGEEPHAWRIARAIVQTRTSKAIRTTLELARTVESVSPRKGHKHPATLVFQALRIAVNDELAALQDFLLAAPRWLKPGARLAIISFHSLEDRLVKRAFQHYSTEFLDRPEWPEPRRNPDYILRQLTRKPVEPTKEEVAANPRSRSARLRVAERLPLP